MGKRGIDEWIIQIVRAMYGSAHSKVTITNYYSKPTNVHQGTVLSLLLFITVMETPSHEFRIGCPWELLYDDDDIVIAAESLDELKMILKNWKGVLEMRVLKINIGKTTFICSFNNTPKNKITFVKLLCGVC